MRVTVTMLFNIVRQLKKGVQFLYGKSSGLIKCLMVSILLISISVIKRVSRGNSFEELLCDSSGIKKFSIG